LGLRQSWRIDRKGREEVMEKGRGIFMDQVSAKGQCKATAAMEPANRYSRDQYTQDLYSPRWRGPFEGYR